MSKRKKLSSNLTFIYKFIIPLFLVGLIVFVNLTIDSKEEADSVITINIALTVFSLIAYLPLMNVEYTKSKLIVSNFRTVQEYNLKNVKDISCGLFFFTKL